MPHSLRALMEPAANFDEPIDMLAACHGRIAQQCETLARMIDHVAAHGVDARVREAAQAVVRYFDVAGENHHCDEEEDLFPALRRNAGTRSLEIEVLLAALLVEHARMRRAWREKVRPQLAALADGSGSELETRDVAHFLMLYRNHIAREGLELMPLARSILSNDQLREIGKVMAARRGAKPASGAAA